MAGFFIHRPVFAWVIAIIIMVAGAYGLTSLPISQYPEIAPTTVRISASYTGAYGRGGREFDHDGDRGRADRARRAALH